MHRNAAIASTLALLMLGAGNRPSYPIDIDTIGGHSLQTVQRDGETTLRVDDQDMHKDRFIAFDQLLIIDGIPIVIGGSTNGGNACDASPFVLTLPQGQNSKLDGPIDSCYVVHHEIQGDTIVFSTNDIPGEGRYRWIWTFGGGFKTLGPSEFKPDQSQGWDILRERRYDHPVDLLKNGAIGSALAKRLGSDFNEYQRILSGTGAGKFEGDDFIGQTCAPHMCREEEALVFLSLQDRQVFAAWKMPDQKIKVRPIVTEWPEKAKRQLRNWAATWK